MGLPVFDFWETISSIDCGLCVLGLAVIALSLCLAFGRLCTDVELERMSKHKDLRILENTDEKGAFTEGPQGVPRVVSDSQVKPSYARSPRILLASWMSLGMMVTRLAWMAHRLVSSNRPTR